MTEAEVLANLRDLSMDVRRRALADVERAGVASFARGEALVDALRIAVRVGPDAGLAVRLLGQLGPRGTAAALDVCRALVALPSPDEAAETLLAFGTLPAPARAILEAHARGGRAEVAAAAARVLDAI